jgi:hypothetical protein
MRGRENYFKASDYDRDVIGRQSADTRPRVASMKVLWGNHLVGAGFLLALAVLVSVNAVFLPEHE